MAGSATDIAARWATGMAGSTEKWKAGVNAVTTSPGALAARQADAWSTNTLAAKDKWRQRVGNLDLNDWKNAMLGKGQNRIAEGAQQAQGRFADFLTQFLPHVDRVRANLPARGTYAQNKARMNAFVDGVHEFSYKK